MLKKRKLKRFTKKGKEVLSLGRVWKKDLEQRNNRFSEQIFLVCLDLLVKKGAPVSLRQSQEPFFECPVVNQSGFEIVNHIIERLEQFVLEPVV